MLHRKIHLSPFFLQIFKLSCRVYDLNISPLHARNYLSLIQTELLLLVNSKLYFVRKLDAEFDNILNFSWSKLKWYLHCITGIDCPYITVLFITQFKILRLCLKWELSKFISFSINYGTLLTIYRIKKSCSNITNYKQSSSL